MSTDIVREAHVTGKFPDQESQCDGTQVTRSKETSFRQLCQVII